MRKQFILTTLLLISMLSTLAMSSQLNAAAAPLAQSVTPTIASDQADYPPGATVTLTGAGWASGEAVHIVVNDTIGQTWQRSVNVTASSSGDFTDVFTLPNYFV